MGLNGERSLDEILTNMRRDCTIELAGMIKEKRVGSVKEISKILARFCLQEGRTMRKAREYLRTLEEAGLVSWKAGHKSWSFNSKEEWELFRVNI